MHVGGYLQFSRHTAHSIIFWDCLVQTLLLLLLPLSSVTSDKSKDNVNSHVLSDQIACLGFQCAFFPFNTKRIGWDFQTSVWKLSFFNYTCYQMKTFNVSPYPFINKSFSLSKVSHLVTSENTSVSLTGTLSHNSTFPQHNTALTTKLSQYFLARRD